MIKRMSGLLALTCLGVGLAASVRYFVGRMSEGGFKLAFGLASIGWFVFATAWLAGRRKKG
ncbi:MAG: hypothetical protein JW742_08145 [Candidatus Aminicenantes bacterium]|nr:hypothetical protein [Candidatus Aminicenantes bacterium]